MPDETKPATPAETAQTQQTISVEKPEKRILGFKQNVFYLGIVSLLNDAASEIIYPLLPIFLKSVLGASYAVIGVIEGIAEGAASLMKLLSGWFSDKIQKNKVFVFIGYLIATIVRPLVAFVGTGWHVLAVRLADRVGKGIRTAPRDALIANSVSESERGKSFGFHRAMDHFGAVVGSLMAFVLVWIFSANSPDKIHRLRYIFLFAFIPGIISLFFIAAKVKDVQTKTGDPEQKPDKSKPKVKLSLAGMDGRFKAYLLILGLFTLGNSTDAFLLLRATEVGLSAPLVWAVFHIIKSSLSTPAGMISDKVGRKFIIIAGWLIYAGVYFGFGFTQGSNSAWILFMVYGVYYALTEGVAKALVADFSPKEMKGTAFGWFHFVEGITLIPASIIFGALYGWSPKFAFAFGACLALAAAVLLIIFVPGKPVAEVAMTTASSLEGASQKT
jgi:MFS family permease